MYEQNRYIAPYNYLINRDIREYDISKANISILRDFNIIDEEKYLYLFNLPKKEREIKIGLMIRNDYNIQNILNNGFKESRRIFFENNNINDMNVLYIDKDSITTIDQTIKNNKVSDHIIFLNKNRYTSFYRLKNIDFLYYNDERNESFRFKNVNEKFILENHKKYMIDFLLSLAYTAQHNILDAISMLTSFYDQYTKYKLDIGFYREFDQNSNYKIISNSNTYQWFSNSINQNMLFDKNLDISFNAVILRELYKDLMNEYFIKGKGANK